MSGINLTEGRVGDFLRVLGDVQGPREQLRLIMHLLGSRLGGDGSPGAAIRVPFKQFDVEFELAQGEIAPYAQMLRDLDEGLIPTGPDLETWTIIDCGANVGLFSLFLKRARRIVAVEPNPGANRRLKRNFEANGIAGSTIQAAISDKDGAVLMDFDGPPSVLNTIGTIGTEVPCVRLDTVFREEEIETIDLLKLDVEGHEIQALEGCAAALARGTIKRIIAEYNDSAALAKLDQHLSGFGFQRMVTGRFNVRFEPTT